MIIRMSKIEVLGPREQLVAVLDSIRATHTLHIDPDIQLRMRDGPEAQLRLLEPEPRAAAERVMIEDLAARIDRVLALIPASPARSRFDEQRAATSVALLVDVHLGTLLERTGRRQQVESDLKDVHHTLRFLTVVDSLAPKDRDAPGVDVVAVEVGDPSAIDRLAQHAAGLDPTATLKTARGEDGSYIGVLTTEKATAARLRDTLQSDQMPQVPLPSYVHGMTLSQQLTAIAERGTALDREREEIDRELADFAAIWREPYLRARASIEERLALLQTTVLAYGTNNCFVLFGWLPTADVPVLRAALARTYGASVVIEEKALLDQDLEMVPVIVRNPGYLRPFELFTSLLPLPLYTSIDPTPFIAVFFPLFFGMILGDVGYGVVLLLTSIALLVIRPVELRRHLGTILAVCSVYTILFGILYGEYFGDAGALLFGATAWIDRRESFLPMLYFAVTVGSAHVLVGLILGIVVAMRGRHTREAATRLLTLIVLLCVLGVIASFALPIGAILRRPLLLIMAFLAPALLIVGGLLAPFELIRHLGNIVSYARLMAVGLASVLLAYVANRLAGAVGSLWVGVTAAVLLHVFNIILGVFAPTVHALRLHYVEFFSKFLETGGRPYRPLKEAK